MSLISKRAQKFQTSGIRKIFDMSATLKKPINFSIGHIPVNETRDGSHENMGYGDDVCAQVGLCPPYPDNP